MILSGNNPNGDHVDVNKTTMTIVPFSTNQHLEKMEGDDHDAVKKPTAAVGTEDHRAKSFDRLWRIISISSKEIFESLILTVC